MRYGDGGPVRFVEAHLPFRVIDSNARAAIVVAFNQMASDWLDSEPLF